MAWRRTVRDYLFGARPTPALTSAATVVTDNPSNTPRAVIPSPSTWQQELWGFFDTLGEFTFVVNWKASMASRVRLRAGKMAPDSDEPTIVTTGVAADIVAALGGGVGGQSAIMADLMTQLTVPGEGWVVGETIGGDERWRVVSADELRQHGSSRRPGTYEIIDENSPPQTPEWRPLGVDAVIVRVWRPHPRLHYHATSPARSSLPTMRELDLVNRKIQAQYLSRLASAGMLVLPDEIEFPVREEFADAANPFFSELIAVATEAIKTPGSAAATVPIPISVPAEYADKITHIDFTLKLDEKEIEKREQVIRRLATQLDVPAEVLTGIGEINHWGAWAIEEQAVKVHICPDIELVTWALTLGYLWPRLQASGESIDDWVVWYDASEIIQRPDRSKNANDAYDRLEINPEAYRRETGFDEADKPSDDEVERMAYKKLAILPATGIEAVDLFMGRTPILPQAPAGAPGKPPGQPPEAAPTNAPPQAPGKPPAKTAPPPQPAPKAAQDELLERLVEQASTPHALVFSATEATHLDHPRLCLEHLGSCPFTRAMYDDGMPVHPGTSGAYECRLSPEGRLIIGVRVHPRKNELIEYTPPTGADHGNGRS